MTTVLAWLLIAICLWSPKDAFAAFTFPGGSHEWIADTLSWILVGSKSAWLLFLLVLFCSKYGRLKLAPTDDCQPEFSTITWFMMLFGCGIGCEIFFFGVSEPVYHYSGRFMSDKMPNRHSLGNSDDRAAWALESTMIHWGIHPWVIFTISGLTIAFMSHRKGLPMTLRSCFYPFLGDKVFGFMGDVIDTVGAIATMVGICVILAQGALDLNTVLARLSGCASFTNENDCNDNSEAKCKWADFGLCQSDDVGSEGEVLGFDISAQNQIILIWVMTLVASVSVVLGLRVGIRTISVVSFLLGFVLLFNTFFVGGNPWFFLDVMTQQLGIYVQESLGAGLHTDAFARHSLTGDGGANSAWLTLWTMFYCGIWAAWAPFAGMFIANISKGRTIREFIIGTTMVPAVFLFIWFNVFGASGINMERTAELVGLTGAQSPTYLKIGPDFNVSSPRLDLCPLDKSTGRPLAGQDCIYASRLSERPLSDMWLDNLAQFPDLISLVFPMSFLAIFFYFITSSDSASLVIDILCSNGADDSRVLQRLYWSVTEGACATALLIAGHKSSNVEDAVYALFGLSVTFGAPITIVITFMCASLWKACRLEYGDAVWDNARFFAVDLLEVFDIRLSVEWLYVVMNTCLAFFFPTFVLWRTLRRSSLSHNQQLAFIFSCTACFYLWPILGFLNYAVPTMHVLGWWFYFSFVSILCMHRRNVRIEQDIDGNLAEDWFACMFLFPCVVVQLESHFKLVDRRWKSADLEHLGA
eukprot:GEMP01005400.1.p1 GENE.GEMP01005400.1~~GEMP01005400.1.p1  ORF type:complete len:754 (+),score=80.70 GEMP01005400.1:183-2444(+)